MINLKKFLVMPVMCATCGALALGLGACGKDKPKTEEEPIVVNPHAYLSLAEFREARGDYNAYFMVGSGETPEELDESVLGHIGQQSADAVVVAGDVITVNASKWADQIAFNFANMFGTLKSNFTKFDAYPKSGDAYSDTAVDLLESANVFYDQPSWTSNAAVKSAYFHITSPNEGASKSFKFDITHDGMNRVFYITINRAE